MDRRLPRHRKRIISMTSMMHCSDRHRKPGRVMVAGSRHSPARPRACLSAFSCVSCVLRRKRDTLINLDKQESNTDQSHCCCQTYRYDHSLFLSVVMMVVIYLMVSGIQGKIKSN